MFSDKHFKAECQRTDPSIPPRTVKHQPAASHGDGNVFLFIHKNVSLMNPLSVAGADAALPYVDAHPDLVAWRTFNTHQTQGMLFPPCISVG